MARAFHLSIVAPDRSVVETEVHSVIAPGLDGYFGVMAGHQPLIAALRPGILEYLDTANNRRYVAVGGGFAEVTGEHVTVLADDAVPSHEIDLAKAEEDLEEARRALRGEPSRYSNEQAVDALERAMNRVRAARTAR
jgi:F-type H+-transporting ATPase subunit epsilon